MAEYGIYEVHYDDDHAKIEEVHAYKITDNSTDGKHTFSRDEVISKIEANNKVITLIKKDNGNWERGSEVIVYEVDNEKFIKTERNSKKEDNLGELPEY
ncbi:hypothetical protein CLOACE_02940 [Clostridium acetireducens DSM 10703]|uniref:DUF3892 domain-containing protein n=1 Tax=Clostridium acetireducens DSM 10703 TaxID=1121290 RepID=A0A1E8F1F7_9CLOT|nr:DUF3892 domain-containing protein [Clostridium acetireducens]OFI07465.1 hypothetical protein CLOACE_02940 [Clostridium acetireducens DSM 10703]